MEKLSRTLPAVLFFLLALPPLLFALAHTTIVRPIQKGATPVGATPVGATPATLSFWTLVDDVTLNRLSFNWQIKSEKSQQASDLAHAQLFAWLALKKNPQRAQNMLRLTEALGNHNETFLHIAVALDPHNAHYRLTLAKEQVALGKTKEAQENIDAALASDAGTIFTYFLSQKMPIPSLHALLISGLEKRIVHNPKDPDGYGYLADWYRYNDQFDLAIEVTERGYANTQEAYLLQIKKRCEYLKEKGLSGP